MCVQIVEISRECFQQSRELTTCAATSVNSHEIFYSVDRALVPSNSDYAVLRIFGIVSLFLQK